MPFPSPQCTFASELTSGRLPYLPGSRSCVSPYHQGGPLLSRDPFACTNPICFPADSQTTVENTSNNIRCRNTHRRVAQYPSVWDVMATPIQRSDQERQRQLPLMQTSSGVKMHSSRLHPPHLVAVSKNLMLTVTMRPKNVSVLIPAARKIEFES